MTPLAAYVLLFVAVGAGFILVHLLAGKLIRPNRPSAEKGTIYECGEPTIGSAWIQFDLRFYVVALLFVIFDVEVAFFFPWAEVFGKANAVANAPPARDARDYRATAEKALDLASPGAADVDPAAPPPPAEDTRLHREARAWQALARLSDEQLASYRLLDEAGARTTAVLRDLRPATYRALQALDQPKREALRALGQKFDAAIKQMIERQRKEVKVLGPALAKATADERANFDKHLSNELRGRESLLRARPLQQLAEEPVAFFRLLEEVPPDVRDPLLKKAPEAGEAREKLAREQRAAWMKTVAEVEEGVLAVLAPAAKGAEGAPPELRADVTGALVTNLAAFTDEHYDAMAALPQATLRALKNSPVGQAKTDARRLAWLALLEVLVFFGVLLVGFAYLWKRGDLAWVRSTAAEQPEGLPAAAKPETMGLETAKPT
jgi:NADH-quinone oxidoreductase subunit A